MSYNRKHIKVSKAEYQHYSEELFEKIFFCENSGGYLICHIHHGSLEKSQNVKTGMVLAQKGFQVKLLVATKNDKSPDADIDGVPWEFKTIRKAKQNISNAIQNHFYRATLNNGQSPNIVLHINQTFEMPSLINGLERVIKADKAQYFQKVMVIYKKVIVLIYRREIYFGKAKRKLQRLLKN